MFKLSQRSLNRLIGVNENLVNVVKRAIEISEVDFMVVEGLRTKQRQEELYAQGRTKPGKVVTWTMKSKHIDGLAVDIAPCNKDGSINWNDLKMFDKMADAMFKAAKELNINIRHGADWNMNGIKREKGETDSPHFELV
jgi:D-alanyl-D-alanine dipeptidase